jgi:hypothetical protein
VNRLARFERVASLRNQLAIAHGFSGVSLQKLACLYPGGAPHIAADMEALLAEVLGAEVSDNPYDGLNGLCQALLEG